VLLNLYFLSSRIYVNDESRGYPLQCQFLLLRARVRAAFFADADFSAKGRRADALPPIFPPFLYGAELTRLP